MKIARKLAIAFAAVAVSAIGVLGVSAPAHADVTWGVAPQSVGK